MHSAPSVSYPVGRSRFQAALLIVVALAMLAVSLFWWAAAPWDWRMSLMLVLLCLALLFAWQAWRYTQQGTLAWNGVSWRFTGSQSSVVGAVSVPIDLQSTVLLKVTPQDGPQLWLWAERRRLEPLWIPLRLAVFSRQVDAPQQTHKKGLL